MTSFYKTTDASVLAAHATFEAAKDALIEKANLLGKEFDGKPKFCSDVNRFKCAHLVLNNYYQREDKDLWTKPDQNYLSAPRRGKVKGKTKEQQELQDRYWEMFPESVEANPLYESMGISWGDLLFGGGFTMFAHDGAIYLRTGAKVGSMMTEILGSEFNTAEQNLRKEKAA
ncbi:hypothetical protein [Aeromonas hydrophila]|uniref:hypothetical protein n=1 Tax=Aeromonas hydrophila TaxID=644 RepID=UPI002B49E385|nr:hypothetical protein [Aeromonas hydrophila]